MEPAEIMKVLLALSEEAGLEIRTVRASAAEPGEPTPSSAVCRVRGAVWVLLSTADPVEIQLDVVCEALREHAAEVLEDRYLPPAIRARLDRGPVR